MKEKFLNHQDMYKYEDMIDLPHPVSRTHPQMPVKDRAAQFAPFAALAGHYDAVKETARLTDDRIELDEYCKAALDRKLTKLREGLGMGAEETVAITYFVPDVLKEGGSYVTVTGCVKKIDEYERILLFRDGTRIPVDEIIAIKVVEEKHGRKDNNQISTGFHKRKAMVSPLLPLQRICVNFDCLVCSF